MGYDPLDEKPMKKREAPGLFDEDRKVYVRNTDPQTSRNAAQTVDLNALEQLTLDALREHGPMTTHEIAAKVGRERDSISPRMKKLVAAKLVRDSGERRVPEGRSKAAIVWEAM